MSWQAIGIFDSGVGGLTVLRELTRALPQEDTIYFGDTARVPYGTKSPDTVIRYSQEITSFLITPRHQAAGGGLQYRLGGGTAHPQASAFRSRWWG